MRCADGSYEVRIEAPLTDIDVAAASGNEEVAAAALTQAYLARVEAWIGEYPDQWLCLKRRWPKPGSVLADAGASDQESGSGVVE